ncbi:MAG: hypothetical protein ACYTF1_05005 [Planctomycetota bacterium]|jgi:hypothetical protein
MSSMVFGGEVIDASTLTGKVVSGYQGWFTCPGDGAPPEMGWGHWSLCDSIGPGCYAVEMWPDVSEFDSDELFLADKVKLTDGKRGYLFSSVRRKTVMRHFKWMKDAGIDGVFLQRFLTDISGRSGRFEKCNMVLANVRAAAATHGRVFALEYDCNGGNAQTLFEDITGDWKYLVDTLRLTGDPRYLHHKGKPVVIIWGLGFKSPTRPFPPRQALRIIRFFKDDPVYGGNYCIGGVPTGWRTLSRDSRSDPNWGRVYREWDAVHPWTVGRYTTLEQVNQHKMQYWGPDIEETRREGMDYLPVVWPGFSWDNLKRLEHGSSLKPRLGGRYLWSQIHAARFVGAEMIFVAMFDEVDEATAIFKVSDAHPVTGHWISNKGLPADWYLRLAGSAGRMLRGEIPLTETFPIYPDCNGDEVFFNLGEDEADRVTHPMPADDKTKPVTRGGVLCRGNVDSGSCMYFAVDDAFAFEGSQPKLCIAVDYYDMGGGKLILEYDSNTGKELAAYYKSGGGAVLDGTNKWKRHLFHLTEAWLGNRQNGGADFRIRCEGGGLFSVDRVVIMSTVPKPPKIKLDIDQLNRTTHKGGNLPKDSFELINVGVAALCYSITDNASWFKVSPASGRSTGEPDTIEIIYTAAQLGEGSYSAEIRVEDKNAANSPQIIKVNLGVSPD